MTDYIIGIGTPGVNYLVCGLYGSFEDARRSIRAAIDNAVYDCIMHAALEEASQLSALSIEMMKLTEDNYKTKVSVDPEDLGKDDVNVVTAISKHYAFFFAKLEDMKPAPEIIADLRFIAGCDHRTCLEKDECAQLPTAEMLEKGWSPWEK